MIFHCTQPGEKNISSFQGHGCNDGSSGTIETDLRSQGCWHQNGHRNLSFEQGLNETSSLDIARYPKYQRKVKVTESKKAANMSIPSSRPTWLGVWDENISWEIAPWKVWPSTRSTLHPPIRELLISLLRGLFPLQLRNLPMMCFGACTYGTI